MPWNTVPFSELESADLDLMSSYGVIRAYPKGAVLINEGDNSTGFFIILSGKVKVYVSNQEGREVVLNIQRDGEYFGELALIDEAPRSASVITLEASQFVFVSKAGFQKCLSEHPEIAVKLIRSLSKRIRALTESVKNLALLDVYGRVSRVLENLAVSHEEKFVIKQRLTHQEIANMTGASREMVSRIIRDLVKGGYIQVKDKIITIHRKLPHDW